MNIKETKCYCMVRKLYYALKNWDTTKDDLAVRFAMRKFKNRHKGQTCVVIGNGPSLKAEDLTRIAQCGIPTFACNRIHLIFPQTPWRPTYYFMSDEKLINQYGDHIDDVPAENRFFPKMCRDRIKNGNFYNQLMSRYDQEGRFSLHAGKGVYTGCTITAEMLQFAYFMGFHNIYLIGVDFSYQISKKLDDVTYSYQGENNYFIPGYLKPGEVADMPNVNANLLAFHAAKEAIEGQGRIVQNATRGGKLEVFTRVNLDELLQKWEEEQR
jgi:hypothetical protein